MATPSRNDLRDDLAVLIATAQDSRAVMASPEDHAAADAILAEYYVISRTPLPRTERPVCPACGTWQCQNCFYRRVDANRMVEQDCKLCGSKDGKFLDTRHVSHHKYLDHLQALESYAKDRVL